MGLFGGKSTRKEQSSTGIWFDTKTLQQPELILDRLTKQELKFRYVYDSKSGLGTEYKGSSSRIIETTRPDLLLGIVMNYNPKGNLGLNSPWETLDKEFNTKLKAPFDFNVELDSVYEKDFDENGALWTRIYLSGRVTTHDSSFESEVIQDSKLAQYCFSRDGMNVGYYINSDLHFRDVIDGYVLFKKKLEQYIHLRDFVLQLLPSTGYSNTSMSQLRIRGLVTPEICSKLELLIHNQGQLALEHKESILESFDAQVLSLVNTYADSLWIPNPKEYSVIDRKRD